jgi:flagellar hook-associated protein 2
MSSINFIGSYSGIDKGAIEQLIQVEKLPLVSMAAKKTNITDMQNAWKDIKTRLKSLFDKAKALQGSEVFKSKTAISTNENKVTMNAGISAAPAQYKINVEILASSSRVVGSQITADDANTALNIEGSFRLTTADSKYADMDVLSSDSLKSIMDKINLGTKETGIRATVIDRRLVVEDSKTGARQISIDNIEGKTSVLEEIGLGISKEQITGADAKFSVNGINITRSTNSVSDVIDGVTINLNNKHEAGEFDTVRIEFDVVKAEKAIKDFVDQYNSTMTFIEDKMSAGAPGAPSTRGVLAGDGSLQRLHSSLRHMITSSLANTENTSIRDISALGVKTLDKFGKLSFDPSKLRNQLMADPQNVINFFARDIDGTPSGFVERINSYVDSFISTNSGVIKGKTESFEMSLKDITKQIENFNKRVERKEQYYIKMFSALDVAMMQAESQMQWLNGQVSAMNAQASGIKR